MDGRDDAVPRKEGGRKTDHGKDEEEGDDKIGMVISLREYLLPVIGKLEVEDVVVDFEIEIIAIFSQDEFLVLLVQKIQDRGMQKHRHLAGKSAALVGRIEEYALIVHADIAIEYLGDQEQLVLGKLDILGHQVGHDILRCPAALVLDLVQLPLRGAGVKVQGEEGEYYGCQQGDQGQNGEYADGKRVINGLPVYFLPVAEVKQQGKETEEQEYFNGLGEILKKRTLGEKDDSGIPVVLEDIAGKGNAGKAEPDPAVVVLQNTQDVLQIDIGRIFHDLVPGIEFDIA